MTLTAEISMYPLQENYEPPILAFIEQLKRNPDIQIITNAMSTQIKGPFEVVSHSLQEAIRNSIKIHGKAVFVVKYIGDDLPILEGPNLESRS